VYSSKLKESLQDTECAYNTMENWLREVTHKIGDMNELMRQVRRKVNQVDEVCYM